LQDGILTEEAAKQLQLTETIHSDEADVSVHILLAGLNLCGINAYIYYKFATLARWNFDRGSSKTIATYRIFFRQSHIYFRYVTTHERALQEE
jgi:hypothetical protein